MKTSRLFHLASRWLPLFLGVALALPILGGCDILGLGDGDSGEPGPDDTTVLFLGSSYLAYHDVPDRFEGFAHEGGEGVYVRSYLLPGHYLDYFAGDAQTAQLLRARPWDYVVLQGGGFNVAYADASGELGRQARQHPVLPALRELKRLATESSPGTRVVYMLPWAFEDGMLWVEGETDDYAAMQLKIREKALEWNQELDLALAPVGMAFHRVMTTWDPPEHFLYEEDWNHANATGAYLTAATLFSTVFARSVEEVSYRWKLERELARSLRGVASSTVMDSLALWNIAGG